MRAVTFATLAGALVFRNAMNARLGYPRAATSRGSACPPHPFGQTTRCARIVLNSTLGRRAVQESDEILAEEPNVSIGAGLRELVSGIGWDDGSEEG